ncbi:MAG: hypothetical protein KatS3mg076_0458 [Candidatus Binatia bacterium]|nr:MAG: hypothetical protein KatS3mg076_0458 [Candidatus Binatia bacterium]
MRAKRVFDVLVAAVGLVLLLPLFLLVALLIKLDSRGPVFFRQKRVGRDGKLFEIYKFRTMVDGAYRMGSRLTAKRDPRVTRVGQVLRWFKIDELPQLINVVRGEMSLIGPRPEDPYFVQFYTPRQRKVLSVRPGIVGPSQIEGRDELESYPEGIVDTERYYIENILPEKLERDLRYVEEATFFGDLKLLLRGLWVTVVGAIKTKYLWRRRRRIALMAADVVLSALSFLAAYLVRFDFTLPRNPWFLVYPLLLLVVVRPVALLYFGAYQAILKYFALWDLMALFRAVTVGSLVVAGLTFLGGLQNFPRSVVVIDWALALFLLGGFRFALRSWVRRHPRGRRQEKEKVLIVGAGVGGEQIARALLEDPSVPYEPAGLIDESPERWGSMIHGVKILGGLGELGLAIQANGVRTVFVCLSDLDRSMVERTVEICESAGVHCRFVPTLNDLLNGQGAALSVRAGTHVAARTA